MQQFESDFYLRCGRALRFGQALEGLMEFVIAAYLVRHGRKHNLIRDSILTDLGFEKKVQLLKAICKAENVTSTKTEEMFNAIKKVQDTRNKVAHQEAIMQVGWADIGLRSPKSISKGQTLFLNDNVMEEIDSARGIATQRLFELHRDFEEKKAV